MKKLLSILSILFITSCAFPSTKEGMTVTNYKSPKKIGDKIFVKESVGGSITLPFWTSKIPNDNFTAAVKDSLTNSKAFSALASNWEDDWGLEINILDLNQPLIGIDFTVRTSIQYRLYLKGKKVYEIVVPASGVATPDDSLFAIKRLRIANENSAKANIQKFIEEISNKKFE